jgi:hypothetical protein
MFITDFPLLLGGEVGESERLAVATRGLVSARATADNRLRLLCFTRLVPG